MKGIEAIDRVSQLLAQCFATYERPTNFFIWSQESNKWSQLSASEVLSVTNHALKTEANREQSEEAELTLNTKEEHMPLEDLPSPMDSDREISCNSDSTHALHPSDNSRLIGKNIEGAHGVCLVEPELIDISAWESFSPFMINRLVTVLNCKPP